MLILADEFMIETFSTDDSGSPPVTKWIVLVLNPRQSMMLRYFDETKRMVSLGLSLSTIERLIRGVP